ncbi:MAG: GTPase HflX [Acidaminobacteraceae bacterium]
MLLKEENEIILDIDERAVLVAFNDDKGDIDIKYSMNELAELTRAADVYVCESVIQNKKTIDPAFYIGKGKVQEIKELVEFHRANVVIFNDELSGSQIRNLEGEMECKVIDRTALILDIFIKRAKTKESKLQIELAQLRYRLPRLRGMGNSLSRTGSGVGARGPGEQKLEIDRRRIDERISDIGTQLKEVQKNRETQRSQRSKNEVPVVALVGYTNAGKSTVMNKLLKMTAPEDVEKQVFEKDMLFATLDTSHRRIKFPDNKEFILVDTIGFVSKLPHALVQAFKATLEEVTEADLLIHVVDSTNSDYHNQIKITEKVLSELGVTNKETIFAVNKIDLLTSEQLSNLPDEENSLKVSAVTGLGIDTLIEKIKSSIYKDVRLVKMLIPFNDGAAYSDLCDNSSVISTEYVNEGTEIKVEVSDKEFNKYSKYIID